MARFSLTEQLDSDTPLSSEPPGVVLLEPDGDESARSTESVDSGPIGVAAGIVAMALLALVIFSLLGGGPDDDRPPIDRPAEQRALPDNPASVGLQVPVWPDPPIDHDPHVSGRPGDDQPIRAELAGQTLVYVNSRGRPTIVDLSTGYQREVDVAGSRQRDQFFVEQGRVVSIGPGGADLPASDGRAFVFSVHRTAQPGDPPPAVTEMMPSTTGPSLCLDEGRCPQVPFTVGTFGGGQDRATAIESDAAPVESLAEVLQAGWWARDGRWTLFSLGANASQPEVRLPTPMESTVIWVVTQPVR